MLAPDVTRDSPSAPRYAEPDDVIQPTLGAMVTQHPQGTPNSTDTTTSVAGRARFRRTAAVGAVGASLILAMSVLSACSDGDSSTDAGTTPIEGAGSTADSAADPAGTPADTPADSGDNAGDTGNSGGEGRCTTDGLDIALGQSQGAAGSLLVDVNFTNSTSEDCTLSGFPGVTLVDDAGDPLGAPAVREDNAPGGVVDLRPGDSATAALKISRAENYDDQTCGPTPAGGLQVIVPEETDTTVLSFADGSGDLAQVTACTDDSVELLSVQPLTAGA
jgi:hypothetical protein